MYRRLLIISLPALLIGAGLVWYMENPSDFTHDASLLTNTPLLPSSEALSTQQAALSPLRLPTSDGVGLIEPVEEFNERITKKPFGIYITPETSPVQPDRFTGYHTGVDAEYEDVADEIPVRAIADGTILLRRSVSGYGGVIIIRHELGGVMVQALYGHLDPLSFPPETVLTVEAGARIAILGDGYTEETDGARKHLHFALRADGDIDVRGYVETEEELTDWYDPLEFYQ